MFLKSGRFLDVMDLHPVWASNFDPIVFELCLECGLEYGQHVGLICPYEEDFKFIHLRMMWFKECMRRKQNEL